MSNPQSNPPSISSAAQTDAQILAAAIAPQRRNPPPKRGMQPSFKVLIGLTLLTALLLLPFALSPFYLDWLRQQAVELYGLLRGELYKQGTGFATLALVIGEVLLTARKRGRGWLVSIKLPGSMLLWRSLHIFVGVALVAVVLAHTLGATGINFNAVLLWTFFGTTLTALVGVVAETGILESTRRTFGRLPWTGTMLTKGPLIRQLRGLWLASHIFFVCLFGIMLAGHIALVYYYQ